MWFFNEQIRGCTYLSPNIYWTGMKKMMCKFNCRKNPKFQKSGLMFGCKHCSLTYPTPFSVYLSPVFLHCKRWKSEMRTFPGSLQLQEHSVQYWPRKFNWKSLGAFVSWWSRRSSCPSLAPPSQPHLLPATKADLISGSHFSSLSYWTTSRRTPVPDFLLCEK